MNKSPIEWTEFTSNPVRGECPVDCSYCYVKSFRARYGWHKDIRFYHKELEAIRRRKKPAKIFIGSTIELFHDKTIGCMPEIMETVKACPQHTCMFLTKQPQNLIKFSPFPDNCWVGVSATDNLMYQRAMIWLAQVEARVKYISFEPLLGRIEFYDKPIIGLDWVILGSQTKPYRPPKIEWVQEIVEACDKAGIPVFLKDNLRMAGDVSMQVGYLRQEFPNNQHI